MLQKILVPLDGSELAERALGPALALAAAGEGEVTLLRAPWVHPVSVDEYSAGYEWFYPGQAQENTVDDSVAYLDDMARHWAREGVEVHKKVVVGDPASVILDAAAMFEQELICMTTHGYSGLTRWMLGSVTERVLRAAPCAVMVVRESRPMRHILITLDGSTLSERALEPGMEVARRFGGRVTLLQVATIVPAAHDVIYQVEMMERRLGDYEARDAIDHAELYLDSVAERLAHYDLPLSIAVEDGFAAQRIVDYSAGHEVDLIVMATHGRTGLRRWAYGSVTEKVLRSGQCSLLVIRPEEHELKA